MPTTAASGCSIWYEIAGSGPPLVMVYGIGGTSRDWWNDFPARLRERFSVVLLDNRGTGRSDQPREPWSMADMVADVDAVAVAAGLASFHLLGCSLGSVVARHYAASHPEKVRSLSLLCPPNGIGATDEDMKLGILWDPEAPRTISAEKAWVVVHPEPFIRAHRRELLADFERSETERTPGRTFRFQLLAAAGAGDPVPAINAAGYPVHIVHGTTDRLVPPDNARTLAEQIPRAKLTWLSGDSHQFWQHDADHSAGVIGPFIERAETTWRAQ
jgi:pimeloyl-ACP methyl ester carboxylesterase